MAFSYTGDPSSSNKDALRFLIQDTNASDVLMQDAELNFILTEVGNSIYQAAHDACYVIGSSFARKADTSKSVGDLSLSVTYSNRSSEYRDLAERFLELSARREPPIPRYAAAAMVSTPNRDVDTPTTDFLVGQHDNLATRYGHNPYQHG